MVTARTLIDGMSRVHEETDMIVSMAFFLSGLVLLFSILFFAWTGKADFRSEVIERLEHLEKCPCPEF